MAVGWIGRVLILAVIVLGCLAPALACPPGSRFSAGNGNGMCVIIGQGLQAANTCTVARGACPAGTSREHSNNDPTRDYCCPVQATRPFKPHGNCFWVGTAPFCNGKCPAGFQTTRENIDGDGKVCATGLKAYCCPPQ
jgi:hypothetical protein